MPMSMSYVIFENTFKQLLEAKERLRDEFNNDSEERYRTKLIALCCEISDEFTDSLPRPDFVPYHQVNNSIQAGAVFFKTLDQCDPVLRVRLFAGKIQVQTANDGWQDHTQLRLAYKTDFFTITKGERV